LHDCLEQGGLFGKTSLVHVVQMQDILQDVELAVLFFFMRPFVAPAGLQA
jgi:hypothetical protein